MLVFLIVLGLSCVRRVAWQLLLLNESSFLGGLGWLASPPFWFISPSDLLGLGWLLFWLMGLALLLPYIPLVSSAFYPAGHLSSETHGLIWPLGLLALLTGWAGALVVSWLLELFACLVG